MRAEPARSTTIHLTRPQPDGAGDQRQAVGAAGNAAGIAAPTAATPVERRPDFQGILEDLRRAKRDSPLFWTTPWQLVDGDMPSIRQGAWPDDLFRFFVDAVPDENIMETDGSYEFFNVLHEYHSALTDAQKTELARALEARALLTHPAWVANCRLKELLGGRQALEKILQDSLTRQGDPTSIGNAIALFDHFDIVSKSLTSTRCSVRTARSGEWQFDVNVSYLKLQRGKAPDPTIRDDLITSQIAGEQPLKWLQQTRDLLPYYSESRRRETLLALPAALADTQKFLSDSLGWDPDILDAFQAVTVDMEAYNVSPLERFGAVLDALAAPCTPRLAQRAPAREVFMTLSRDQKQDLLQWLGEHVNEFTDPQTREMVAKFIVTRYPTEAGRFFDELEAAVHARLNRQCVTGLVTAGRDCLRREEKGESPSRWSVQRSRSGSSVSPAPERVESAPARLRQRLSVLAQELPPLSPRSLSTPKPGTPGSGTPKAGR